MRKSKYSDFFDVDRNIEFFETVTYDKDSYDSFIWALEKQRLLHLLERLNETHKKRLKYLDFACGTGRVSAAVEAMMSESVGLDLSEKMLAVASQKVKKTRLLRCNILEDSNVVDFDYDVITAFRFFLNTEFELGKRIMDSLVCRLRDPTSRLIFNIHRNKWSMLTSEIPFRRRTKKNYRADWASMSYKDVSRLVESAGLEIESWCGFGLCPFRLHNSRLRKFARFIDCFASKLLFLKWISCSLLFVCKPKGAK